MRNMLNFLLIYLLFFCGLTIVHAEEFPTLYVNGDLSNMTSKKDIRKVHVNYVNGDTVIDTYATIKLQGTGSLVYDKKNYTIEFYQDSEYLEKLALDVGWGNQSKYCLKANWVDKTHARNIVTARLAAQMQQHYNILDDTPNNGVIDGFPISLYVNGEFLGLYTWNIPKEAWMFNIDEDDYNSFIFSPLFTFFAEEVTPDDGNFEIEFAKDEDVAYDALNRLITFVKDSSDEEFRKHFEEYLDLNATINYFIMGNYAMLIDDYKRNMLLVTYDGMKWFPSLYDLEASFGTDIYGQAMYSYDRTKWSKNMSDESVLWNRLEANFPNEIADQYFELRKDILTYDNTMSLFNQFVSSIPNEVYEMDAERWKNSISTKNNLNGVLGEDISQIEEWLPKRIEYLDQYFTSLYTIEPNVAIVYSEENNSVTATLATNRKDIIITNNNGQNKYTFHENGSFIFEWQTKSGDNHGTIIATVDNITSSKKYSTSILEYVSLSFGVMLLPIVVFFYLFLKKRDT